jgi:hypothetical protein
MQCNDYLPYLSIIFGKKRALTVSCTVDNAVFIALVVDRRPVLRYDNDINKKPTIYQEQKWLS